MTQPRSFELFEFLGIIDPVMKRSIKPPTARMYKGPEGVEILKEFMMTPEFEPTPAKPYVCVLYSKQCSLVNQRRNSLVLGAVKLPSPRPAEFGRDNTN